VPDFGAAEPPDAAAFDAVVCTLPWERLLEVAAEAPECARAQWAELRKLDNVHPLTIRL
jgi:hypothetical protein